MNISISRTLGALTMLALVTSSLFAFAMPALANHSGEEEEASHSETVHDEDDTAADTVLADSADSAEITRLQTLLTLLTELLDLLKHRAEHEVEDAADHTDDDSHDDSDDDDHDEDEGDDHDEDEDNDDDHDEDSE